MRKPLFALLAGLSLAGLAACSDTDDAMMDDAAEQDAAAEAEPIPDAQASMAADDSASISADENGVSVDVNRGDATVSADTEGGMSASVETE